MSSELVGAMIEKNDKKRRIEPALRFPDFRDKLSWHFEPLRKLAQRKTERNAEERITRVLTNSAEHGVVDQRDYFEKDIASKGSLKTYFVVEQGDYVYNPRISTLAPVGPIRKNKIGLGVMSPLYTIFSVQDKESDFYEHYFLSGKWHNYLRFVANTGARHDRMSISNGQFMDLPVPIPGLAERRKISECLSSIDALIAAQSDKLAALKDHRKGLMQGLFPAEGEIIPKYRFPEFRNAHAWRMRPLSDFLEESKERNRNLIYGVNDVLSVSSEYGCVNQIKHLGRSYAGVSLKEYRLLRKGDVVYTKSPLRDFPYGIIKENLTVDGIVSTLYAIYKIKEGICTGYLNHYFSRSSWLNNYLQPLVKKGAKNDMKVNNSYVLSGEIVIPELDEQQKISECLSSIDAQIADQSDKLKALKDHKRGLMQKLFPGPDEVNG